jgi:lipase maturation factor 1
MSSASAYDGRMAREPAGHPTYAYASWIFLRLLGVVYLLAFWSLSTQILGLVGRDGILPAAAYMDSARMWTAANDVGLDRFRLLPTLCWISTSDAFLLALCLTGVGLAALLVVGIAPAVTLPPLWVAYLSLSVIGRDFLSFQWDALLLEAGVLAALAAPLVWFDRLRARAEPPRLAVWLLVWLLFRLMIGSGIVKLASGDPTWRALTALTFHYETQPIPTPPAWYAHQLPAWWHKASTVATFAIELIVPFFMFAPRTWRMAAFVMTVGLQAIIAFTGNYAFFNLLTAALCVWLLDDDVFRAFGFAPAAPVRAYQDRPPHPIHQVRRAVLIAAAVVIVPVSATNLAGSAGIGLPGAPLVVPLASFVSPFRSINSYGLFAVMTTIRDEIVVEGSDDGVTWSAYEFKYKPGELRRPPPWVAPHQPRLDWQMWFAALGPSAESPWFGEFCARLLEGSASVQRLLGHDPFGGRPPRYIRAELYRYHFSDWAAGRGESVWWTRERLGEFSLPMSR